MPRVTTNYIPTCVKHASGQAVVRLNGKDHYLGKWKSAAATASYEKLIAEWLAHGRQLPRQDVALSINELILTYWRHCEQHYRRADGTETTELHLVRLAMRPVKSLYAMNPAGEFGPSKLKAGRQVMIDGRTMCRNTINKHVGRIKQMVRGAVENELVPPSVYHGLLAVRGLQRNRSEARKTERVRPVNQGRVDAVRPFVSRQVRAMIDLQIMTGMRPGEACIMRACDLDTTGRIWIYRPESHKTKHQGHDRELYLGPRAQEVVKPFLKTDLQAYLFSPYKVREEHYQAIRQARKSKVQPSQVCRRKSKPKNLPRKSVRRGQLPPRHRPRLPPGLPSAGRPEPRRGEGMAPGK